MKKIVKLSILATLISSSIVQAVEVKLKAMTILSDYKNGFTPSNGSGYVINIKRETPEFLIDGLKVGMGMYLNGDAGLTEWDERSAPKLNKAAYGMVVDVNGSSKALIGELYIDYKNKYFHTKLGRQIINSPLSIIKTSLMPNFYEAYMFDTKILNNLTLTAGHINKISFGSRAMADWGLIGEKTGTAGVGLGGKGVLFEQSGGDLEQAKFHNIGIASGKKDTSGRSIFGITYGGIKNMESDFWVYHSYDIVTDYYTELKYIIPITQGLKLKLNAQYLMQKDTGDALAGDRNFNLHGAKIAIGTKKWGVYAAFNKSGKKDDDRKNQEGQYFNAWGADPAYTSSIFSRNEYRENVSAYKVGGHYKIIKGVKLMMSYTNYGQSLTSAGNSPKSSFVSQNDAYEVDTVLVYKPNKKWMFKVFNVRRLSEYNGVKFNRRMNQYRFISSFKF